MKGIKNWWNNPYPECIAGPIFRWFHRIEAKRAENVLSDREYRLRCIIIFGVAFVILWLLTGQMNPFEFLVDIPISDLEEFSSSVNGNQYASLTYLLFNALAVMVCLYFIKLFIFNAKEDTFFSINGFFFYIMSLMVSALITIPVREITYYVFTNFDLDIGQMENSGPLIGIIIISLILNFILYFTLKESVSAILSSAISIELIVVFQKRFQEIIPNELVFLIVISIISRIILEILEMTGIWEKIAAFCAKWFYTLKYIVKLAFIIVFIIFYFYALINRKTDEKES